MASHFGKFAWFEHVSNDTAKARQFHESLLGWKVKALEPGGYEVIHNGEEFIGGIVAAEAGTPNHWRSWLSVPDVDDRYGAALAAGAASVLAPRDWPGIGRGATVLDPTGARVSLWKGAQGDRDDAEKVAAGDWDWNELSTPDPARAVAFYEAVFGYTHEDGIFKGRDGRARGGVRKQTEGAPMWVPYVKVEDTAATAAKVAPLGGSLLLDPIDVKDVGRAAMLADPLGAVLGLIQPVVKA
jgi:hypothetical protein